MGDITAHIRKMIREVYGLDSIKKRHAEENRIAQEAKIWELLRDSRTRGGHMSRRVCREVAHKIAEMVYGKEN